MRPNQTLNCERLPERITPSTFPYPHGTVPWDTSLVATAWVDADFDGDGQLNDTAFVAQTGGAARVVVRDDAGDLLFDRVLFDPEFRGGGRITAVEQPGPDLLAVTPGPGGGPIVRVLTLDGSVDHTFLAFDADYRGGLDILGAKTDGTVGLLAWPTVAPPNLRLFDPHTGDVLRSVWMAPEDQTGWGVAPVGVFGDGVYVDRDGPGPGEPNPSTRFVPWDGQSSSSSSSSSSL